MQQRRATYGRPSGTDGSDFSYRMVVDSRYQMVAKGMKRLQALNFVEVFFLLVGYVWTHLSGPRVESANSRFISSVLCGVLSLIIGELAKRRSRIWLLKAYIGILSTSMILCITCFALSHSWIEVFQEILSSETKKLDFYLPSILPGMVYIFGLLVFHIFTVKTILALITNMSPPKRAS